MKKIKLAAMQVLSLFVVLPVYAEDVGLHRSSAQPTRAVAAKAESQNIYSTVGQCLVIPSVLPADLKNNKTSFQIVPRVVAGTNYPAKLHDQVLASGHDDAKVTVLQQPKHGILSNDVSPGKDTFYFPDQGYVGNDKAVFLVNKDGYNIKVVLYFKVPNLSLDEMQDYRYVQDKYCNNVNIWKISTNSTARRLG